MRIAQSQTYRGNDWWDWSVWLDAGSVELDDVTEVEWRLHPSFTPSQVLRRNPKEDFRLSTSGWGTFPIKALVRFETGREALLAHDLELFYPDEQEEAPPSRSGGRIGVGGYIHDLDLPASGPEDRDARNAAFFGHFDESQSLIVVGPQIVEYAHDVPAKVRQTICNSLLLAQLAADKRLGAPDHGRFDEW